MLSVAYANRRQRQSRGVRVHWGPDRWRLYGLAVTILLLCSLAVGGTFTTVLLLQMPRQQEMQMPLLREQDARRQAQEAQRQAEAATQRALRDAEATRRVGVNDP